MNCPHILACSSASRSIANELDLSINERLRLSVLEFLSFAMEAACLRPSFHRITHIRIYEMNEQTTVKITAEKYAF
jgi:hypothetical protein